jgi:hypothetical protein
MRKWRFTRPAASPFAAAAAALAIAVAVHALFLLPGYRTKEQDTEAKSPGIQMLNVSSFSPTQQNDFQNWLATHDPSQIARSNSRSGYTAVLKNTDSVFRSLGVKKNSNGKFQLFSDFSDHIHQLSVIFMCAV